MKRLKIFLVSFIIISLILPNLIITSYMGPALTSGTLGSQGFVANEDVRYQQQQQLQQQATATGTTCPAGTTPQCCANGCATTQNTSSLSIPSFTIQILDAKGTVLNPQQPPTNPQGKNLSPQNFQLSTGLLIVQIFPPSNTISNIIGDKNYLIMYTIKDPSGSSVYINYDIIPSASGVPAAINIPSAAASTTQAGITNMANSTSSAAYIPFFTQKISPNNYLQILNGLSPATQKFLLTANPSSDQTSSMGTYTITPISGITDSDVYQAHIISKVNSLKNLSISFDGQTPLITFTGSNISFDSDLQKGVILNVLIYPSNNNNYRVIATLRNTDGSKFRKLYNFDSTAQNTQNQSTLPSTIYITASGLTQSFQRDFFNSNTANSLSSGGNTIYPFNIIAPINLRFLITS